MNAGSGEFPSCFERNPPFFPEEKNAPLSFSPSLRVYFFVPQPRLLRVEPRPPSMNRKKANRPPGKINEMSSQSPDPFSPNHRRTDPMELRDRHLPTVLVIDDYPLFRKGICSVLGTSGDFEVIGQTGSARIALGLLDLKPDIAVIDLEAKTFNALNLLREVKRRLPACRCVVMMTSANNPNLLMAALRLDANGYLLRTVPLDEFLRQMHQLAAGGMAASEKLTSVLAESLREGAQHSAADMDVAQTLTRREFDVLCCVAAGLSNREIAAQLGITDGTVKVHVKHLLKKLAFRSRVEAAIWASYTVWSFSRV